MSRIALLLLLPSLAFAAKLPDVNLVNSSGAPVKLSSFWGKPVILFIESPESATVNQTAKTELKRLSDLHHLRAEIDVLGVATLEGADWWPARNIALGAVAGEERKSQITVLVDFKGALRKAPWNHDPKIPTVMVVSAAGELLFRHDGKLESARLEELKATIEGQLAALSLR